MFGTSSSGNGSRRDQGKTTIKPSSISPLHQTTHAKTVSNGRTTPIRPRIADATKSGPAYETPTNKILNNIPLTVTNRSSERRRRLNVDTFEGTVADKPNFGPAFVVARSSRAPTPTFEVSGPRIRERSDSNG